MKSSLAVSQLYHAVRFIMRVFESVIFCFWLTLTVKSSDVLSTSPQAGNDSCPPWQLRDNSTGACLCKTRDVYSVVRCRNYPYELFLQECYCLTYWHNELATGPCVYTCHRAGVSGYYFNITVRSNSLINDVVCGPQKRRSQMCGECKPGYAPPVYSYSLACVNCTTSNWGKYTAVSFIPLTGFFFFVVTFRISAFSPKLHGFILFSQIVTCPCFMRDLEIKMPSLPPIQKHLVQAFSSFLGIWNLDFFRLVYSPFCLHPHADTLQVMALDYLVAVYPLILIGLSYLLVLLYDKNVRIVVCLYKPFVSFFTRFRRQWNIRNSLVDAFATFFLLSYVKILSVSTDLLLPVAVNGQNDRLYLFNQGDVAYFSRQHLPYACLALFFLLTFTLLPMALLFLYPCSCFQVCLNRTGLSCQSLHIFMDSFQGHYKNGTIGTRDFRSFSALYLLLRLLVYCSLVFTYETKSYSYPTAIILIFTVVTAIANPFKGRVHNVTTTLFLLFLSLTFIFVLPVQIDGLSHKTHSYTPASIVLLVVWCSYITVYFLYWVTPSKVWQSPVLKNVVLQCWKYRFFHRDGYESLQPF
jgi:hypothetical protein